MKKIRWGILGSANIAVEQLLPAMQRSTNATAVAIATRNNVKRANEIAETFGIAKVYQGYETLLQDPEIDAVYIPLPNHVHKEWALRAAAAGKHVLCEKPAALKEADVLEIEAAFTKHRVLFMEAFMYAFHPQHKRVKQLLVAGEIGHVKHMSASFSFAMPENEKAANIRMNATAGGGSIYDLGCYAVHVIRNMLTVEPKQIQIKGKMDATYKVDTDVLGYMALPNDITATFDTSFHLPMRHEYQIFGTDGTIRVPRAFRPDLHGGEGVVMLEKDGKTVTETINGDQYCLQIEHFSDAILQKKTQLKNNLENSIHNARTIDAAYRSLTSEKEETVLQS